MKSDSSSFGFQEPGTFSVSSALGTMVAEGGGALCAWDLQPQRLRPLQEAGSYKEVARGA